MMWSVLRTSSYVNPHPPLRLSEGRIYSHVPENSNLHPRGSHPLAADVVEPVPLSGSSTPVSLEMRKTSRKRLGVRAKRMQSYWPWLKMRQRGEHSPCREALEEACERVFEFKRMAVQHCTSDVCVNSYPLLVEQTRERNDCSQVLPINKNTEQRTGFNSGIYFY
jgi:hypothetical protein